MQTSPAVLEMTSCFTMSKSAVSYSRRHSTALHNYVKVIKAPSSSLFPHSVVDARRRSAGLRNYVEVIRAPSSSFIALQHKNLICRRSKTSCSPSPFQSLNPDVMHDPLLPLHLKGNGSSCRIPKTYASAAGAAGAPVDDDIQIVVEAPPKSVKPWEGAKPIPLILSVAVGLVVRFLVPKPATVSHQAWQLFAIFLSTISGLVLAPLPVGAWAFIGLTVTVLTKTLPFATAFSAFTNEVLWLIVISFFFARGFVKTGLGDRVATYFVKWMGKSTLGLSYGLTAAEALIAPAMPSTTARAGGVFLPIIQSLALASGSKPNDPSSRKLGAFLVQTQFQAAGHSSALYLTGAAQNLLCLNLAKELGVQISNPWVSWFQAASVPALVAMLTTPLLMYKLYPPEIKSTPDAPALAQKKLEALGPVTQAEWVMIGTMLLAVTLWVAGDALGIASVVAAMLGLSILLLLGVLKWDDCLAEKSAWDTLAWFAVLVGMASQLTNLGLVQFMADSVGNLLKSYSLGWPATFGILQGVYFLSHYLFASQTGHVGALYSAILAMQLAAGVPGVLAALALAFNTNLFGALTHYSSGQAAVYFGAGFVDLQSVFKLGAIMAVWNVFIWSVVGAVWWKFLGLY